MVKQYGIALAFLAAIAGALLPSQASAGMFRAIEEGVAVDLAERAAIGATERQIARLEAERAAAALRAKRAAQTGIDEARISQFRGAASNLADGRPYEPRSAYDALADKYGRANVAPHTMPEAGSKNVGLANQGHPVTGVPFDERGYPVFDDHARFDTRIPDYDPQAPAR